MPELDVAAGITFLDPVVIAFGVVAALALLGGMFLFLRRERSVSIPVSVDAIRDVDETPMARATYLIVTSEAPTAGWVVGLRREVGLPLRVLGQVGVIYRPSRWSTRFRSASQIERLFDLVEANRALSIETEDLWIPTRWMVNGHEPKRGDVYRVDLALFQRAFRFRDEQLSQKSFLETSPEGQVSFSPEETEVFRDWARRQIEIARTSYPKNSDRALTWTD